MRTNKILRILLAVLAVALVVEVAYKFNLCNIRGIRGSDVYLRYKDVPGINAAYVKDYRVNDTLTICATLLEAVDSAGWNKLIEDYNIKITEETQEAIEENRDIIISRVIPAVDGDSTTKNVMAISPLNKVLCIFHTKDISERRAVMHRNYDKGNS